MAGGEYFLNFSGPYCLQFGSEGVSKIFLEKIDSVNESMNDNGVCRTAPAKPGLSKKG